jgi:hypothetical protein
MSHAVDPITVSVIQHRLRAILRPGDVSRTTNLGWLDIKMRAVD